jgi:hypothetical protein
MQIIKVSMFTGKTHMLDIPVTEEQIKAWKAGAMIQDAMPNLTADEREFIMTGVTAQEWDDAFGEDVEEHY